MEAINLLLVSCTFRREDEPSEPYGVSCLVSAFKRGNGCNDRISTLIEDLSNYENESGYDVDKVAGRLANSILDSGCNIVAFSNYAWSDKLFKKVLSLLSGTKGLLKIMGGPMVVGNKSDLEDEYPEIDYFVFSYGEKVFANLRNYLDKAEKFIKDLPDFTDLESPYLNGQIEIEKEGMTVRMELRRGCNFNCSYCRYKDEDRKVYLVGNVERWKAELRLFKEKKVAKINVLDAVFDASGENLGMQFLEYCKEIGLKADISLQIRPEILDERMIRLAATMPNVIFEIGIQSLDKDVMKCINRGNRNKVIDTLSKVMTVGIRTEVTIIYGLPKQTFPSFKKDLELLSLMGVKKISAFKLQIYRGTQLYNEYMKYKLTVKENNYGIMQVYDNENHDFNKMDKYYESYKLKHGDLGLYHKTKHFKQRQEERKIEDGLLNAVLSKVNFSSGKAFKLLVGKDYLMKLGYKIKGRHLVLVIDGWRLVTVFFCGVITELVDLKNVVLI